MLEELLVPADSWLLCAQPGRSTTSHSGWECTKSRKWVVQLSDHFPDGNQNCQEDRWSQVRPYRPVWKEKACHVTSSIPDRKGHSCYFWNIASEPPKGLSLLRHHLAACWASKLSSAVHIERVWNAAIELQADNNHDNDCCKSQCKHWLVWHCALPHRHGNQLAVFLLSFSPFLSNSQHLWPWIRCLHLSLSVTLSLSPLVFLSSLPSVFQEFFAALCQSLLRSWLTNRCSPSLVCLLFSTRWATTWDMPEQLPARRVGSRLTVSAEAKFKFLRDGKVPCAWLLGQCFDLHCLVCVCVCICVYMCVCVCVMMSDKLSTQKNSDLVPCGLVASCWALTARCRVVKERLAITEHSWPYAMSFFSAECVCHLFFSFFWGFCNFTSTIVFFLDFMKRQLYDELTSHSKKKSER